MDQMTIEGSGVSKEATIIESRLCDVEDKLMELKGEKKRISGLVNLHEMIVGYLTVAECMEQAKTSSLTENNKCLVIGMPSGDVVCLSPVDFDEMNPITKRDCYKFAEWDRGVRTDLV